MYLGGISVLRALFTGLNTATFLMYGWDKFSAQRGKVRIPETTLLLLAALGGTPGAFLCQELLRHKTRAYNFRRTFFLIAIVQLLLLLTVSMLIS
ncbi:MAG: DUF1294 domain-containing protein [Candidatus Hydrogenedentes bacterium]|nr:DUF1294 domain-containing protein [Candidatus Hydrogenedentota bacterium]